MQLVQRGEKVGNGEDREWARWKWDASVAQAPRYGCRRRFGEESLRIPSNPNSRYIVDAVSDVQNHIVNGGWLLELSFPRIGSQRGDFTRRWVRFSHFLSPMWPLLALVKSNATQ